MALSIGELAGYVTLDTSDFEKKLKETDKSLTDAQVKFRGNAKKISQVTGTALAAGLAVGGAAAFKFANQASDLNETVNKSNAIFGENAKSVEKWASGAAKNMGLSKQAALESAAGFGDMFSQIGFGGDQAAKMSKGVVQMSADLGSFNNLPTADVAERISAAFRGEYDSLQALIPNINAARVEQVAMTETGKKNADAITAQEKAAAVMAIVQKDGARAMGDFARTSDQAANRQKILQAQTQDLGAELGTKLLPAMNKIIGALISTVTWVGNNKTAVGILVGVVGGLTAGVWAVSTAIAAWSTITKVATGVAKVFTVVQKALNWALRANPIGIVITVLALLVGGLIMAYKKSETFRKIVNGALNAVKKGFQVVWNWIKNNFVPFFTKTLPNAFHSVIKWVKKNWPVILAILTGPIGLAVLAITKNWDKITGAFKAARQWVVGTWKRGWSAITGAVSGAMEKGRDKVGNAWNKTKDSFSAAKNWAQNTWKRQWSNVKGWISDPVGSAKDAVRNHQDRIRDTLNTLDNWGRKIFGPRWGQMKDKLSAPIRAAKDYLKKVFGPGGGGIRQIFKDALDAVARIFGRLPDVMTKPIKQGIRVLNRGLVGAWNWVANKLPGVDTISKIAIKGFRGGGSTGAGPADRVAGVVHGNEHVVTDDEVRRTPGGHSTWSRIRAMARAGLMDGFRMGGPVAPVPGRGNQHSGYSWATYAGDFPNPAGTPVKAWKDGLVAAVKRLTTSYGRHVRLNHPDGTNSLYAHLSKILVAAGQRVSAGDIIGRVGNTGRSYGNHLHFETAGGKVGFQGGGSSGVMGFIGDLLGKFKDRLGLGRLSKLGSSPFAELVKGVPRGLAKSATDSLRDLIPSGLGAIGSAASGALGKAKIMGILTTALGMNRLPITQLDNWYRQVQSESGGRAGITQQISDINSRQGNRAQGLLQVIPPTFAAYRSRLLPNNPFNPLANAYAAMNYAKNRYGNSIEGVIGHGHGYAGGTFGASAGPRGVAENGMELVVGPQVRRFRGGERVLNNQQTKQALMPQAPIQLHYTHTGNVGWDPETTARKVTGRIGDQMTMAGATMGVGG